MDEFASAQLGKTLDVLIMGREKDGTVWGRSEYDSPDIDGRVIVSGNVSPGELVRVLITGEDDGDLIGECI